MKRAKVWGSLAAVVTLLSTGAAQAQIFTDFRSRTAPTEAAPTPASKEAAEQFPKIVVGAYAAFWDFPDFTHTHNGQGLPAEQNVDASALVTGDVFLTKRLSIGGWWNPYSGDVEVTQRPLPAGLNNATVYTFDASYWDWHLNYYLPRLGFLGDGWSLQAGYSGLNYELRTTDPNVRFVNTGTRNQEIRARSLNFWVNKAQDIATLNLFGGPRRLSLFGGVGHHTSSHFLFDRAWSGNIGASLELNRRLSLSGSAWFFNIGDDTQTRLTIGLVGRL